MDQSLCEAEAGAVAVAAAVAVAFASAVEHSNPLPRDAAEGTLVCS